MLDADLALVIDALSRIELICHQTRLTLEGRGTVTPPPAPQPYEPQTDLVRSWGPPGDWLGQNRRDPIGEMEAAITNLVELLRDNPAATYADMMQATGRNSRPTIRRYLNDLAKAGRIRRGHGYNLVLDGNGAGDPEPPDPNTIRLGKLQRRILAALEGAGALAIGDLKAIVLDQRTRGKTSSLNRAIQTLVKRGLVREYRQTEGERSIRYIEAIK